MSQRSRRLRRRPKVMSSGPSRLPPRPMRASGHSREHRRFVHPTGHRRIRYQPVAEQTPVLGQDKQAPGLVTQTRRHRRRHRVRLVRELIARSLQTPKEHIVDLQLTEKIIVITGASSGIGRATALTVAAEGAIPILVARSTDKLEKAKAEIEGAGGAADVCTADVTDPAAPARVIATVLEQLGRVYALVNNAGGLHIRTSFLDTTDEQWLATFDLDFHAARRMSRAAVPAVLASGGGSLVHVSSDSGRLPEIGNVDYAAAKLPLLALSKSLATEFSPQGVRSNVVVSGPTRTELYDRPGGFAEQAAKIWGIDKEAAVARMAARLLTRRLGRAEDLASVIAHLVSPLSHQVTAAEWSVDGGIQRQV